MEDASPGAGAVVDDIEDAGVVGASEAEERGVVEGAVGDEACANAPPRGAVVEAALEEIEESRDAGGSIGPRSANEGDSFEKPLLPVAAKGGADGTSAKR